MDKKEKQNAEAEEMKAKVEKADEKVSAEKTEAEKALETANATVADLTKKLEEANGKIQSLTRFAADLDNSRKRALSETEVEVSRMKENILKELLPTLDDFELAVKSAETDTSKDFDKMLEGVEMVQRNMYRRLADNYGLTKMAPEGQPFDPSQHEAIMLEKGKEFKEDTVTQSLVSGYKLGNKVLRSAKVKVGKPAD